MTKIRLLRSNKILYVEGPVPVNRGDRFDASEAPPAETPRRSSGVTKDGVAFFSCRRGSSSAPGREVKSFRFDPKIHEVLDG